MSKCNFYDHIKKTCENWNIPSLPFSRRTEVRSCEDCPYFEEGPLFNKKTNIVVSGDIETSNGNLKGLTGRILSCVKHYESDIRPTRYTIYFARFTRTYLIHESKISKPMNRNGANLCT